MSLTSKTFWASAGLLVYTQAGYPLVLLALGRMAGPPLAPPPAPAGAPSVALIIAARDEEDVIAGKVRNALALDWPRDRLQVVVASDGSTDATVERARGAGAHLVLDLPHGGKISAQDQAVARTDSDLVAFSDANATWEPGALRELAGAFADPAVGYACGRVRFVNEDGTNQEGLYWRFEMFLRGMESRLESVTAGNGAIYATRRASYLVVDPIMGHDLSFPFNMVKRGWRAVDVAGAHAEEKMVPSIEGEFARKRRMMSHAWPIVLKGGLIDPRGYPPRYALMIASHRVLRYGSPFLHLAALGTSAALARRGGRTHRLALAAQLGLLAAAVAGGRSRSRPLLISRYYVLTTASLAAGLADWLRHGTEAGWTAPEGTR